MIFFTKINKSILKFIWKRKRLQIAKAILSQKSNTEGVTIPDFTLYHRAIIIKTTWHWHKSRHEDQWNRLENLGTNPLNYSHLIFQQGSPKYAWEKK
jgi:hypothetical protein